MNIDYEKAWERLADEMNYLVDQGVEQIPPIVVIAYLGFIEDILQWESKEEKCKER